MSTSSSPESDPSPRQAVSLVRRAELVISGVLRGGVYLSAAVIVIGTVLYYATGAAATAYPHTLRTVFPSIAAGDFEGVITLGLLVLLATPIVRVVVSVGAFALERDWRFVVITLVVLVLLLSSVFALGRIFGHAMLPRVGTPGIGSALVIAGASIVAGVIGSLAGLGGGVLVVPILTVGFAVSPEVAVGVSIVSVIATSSGAAAAYVRDRITNLRVGMFLEIATSLGAIGGAFLALVIAPNWLFVIFGCVLLVSAVPLVVKIGEELPTGVRADRLSRGLKLASSYPDAQLDRVVDYEVTHVPAGFGIMTLAGLLSGLLGIGSGTFKVLAMDSAMRLPMKVSTTTSNFMIGVTAAASAGIYFERGDIDPLFAAPVAIGVLIGATIGSKVLSRFANSTIRKIFLPILAAVAIEMLIRGIGGLVG